MSICHPIRPPPDWRCTCTSICCTSAPRRPHRHSCPRSGGRRTSHSASRPDFCTLGGGKCAVLSSVCVLFARRSTNPMPNVWLQRFLGPVLCGARTTRPVRPFVRGESLPRLRIRQLRLQRTRTRKQQHPTAMRPMCIIVANRMFVCVNAECWTCTKSTRPGNATEWGHSRRSRHGTEFLPGKFVTFRLSLAKLFTSPFCLLFHTISWFPSSFCSFPYRFLHFFSLFVYVCVMFAFVCVFLVDPHCTAPITCCTPSHSHRIPHTPHTAQTHTKTCAHRTTQRCVRRRQHIRPANNHLIRSRRQIRTIKWCPRLVETLSLLSVAGDMDITHIIWTSFTHSARNFIVVFYIPFVRIVFLGFVPSYAKHVIRIECLMM